MKLLAFIALGCLATVAFTRPSKEAGVVNNIDGFGDVKEVAGFGLDARDAKLDAAEDEQFAELPEERFDERAANVGAEGELAMEDEDRIPGVKLDARSALLEELEEDVAEKLQARMAGLKDEDVEEAGLDLRNLERGLNENGELDEDALEQLRARFAAAGLGEGNNIEARNTEVDNLEDKQFGELSKDLNLDDLGLAGVQMDDKRSLENLEEILGNLKISDVAGEGDIDEGELPAKFARKLNLNDLGLTGVQMDDKRSLENLEELFGNLKMADLAGENENEERKLQELDGDKREDEELEDEDNEKLAALGRQLKGSELEDLTRFLNEAEAKLGGDLDEE